MIEATGDDSRRELLEKLHDPNETTVIYGYRGKARWATCMSREVIGKLKQRGPGKHIEGDTTRNIVSST